MHHVVLVEPEIAWNTGNAGRTCLAVGAQLHLVRPLGFALDEKQVRRAGLDYWEHVRPVVHESFAAFEAVLPDLGEPFFLCAEAERSLFDVPLPGDAVFVFGKESVGLAPAIRERYRPHQVRLPRRDARVRSLNVSTAVGIVLYEALRRATAAPPPAAS
ncbi:MAG: tRNA (cytidine(34)-2'-O)-methyltransferase [Planctomycetota bacterium]